MNRVYLYFFFAIGAFLLGKTNVFSQEPLPYGKNAISFNLTRSGVCELNMSIEHFISYRKSIEFNGGLIYVNDNLVDYAKDWKNAQVFSEHGYAGRFHYKIFRRVEDNAKKWRDYIAPGLSYRHLYYKEQWFENELTDSKDVKYFERIFQKRVRDKYGLEFLWGKVYEMNRTFAFEFYYGGGICGTTVTRTVIRIQPDSRKDDVFEVNNDINSFYVRPYAMAGIKFRLRF